MHIGKIITFTDNISDIENDFSPGIQGRIVSFIKHEAGTPDEFCEILVDVSEFEEYNKNKWEANYYDDNHVARLKYTETKRYTPRISGYFSPSDFEDQKYFRLMDNNPSGHLYYAQSNKDGSDAKFIEITGTSDFPVENDTYNQVYAIMGKEMQAFVTRDIAMNFIKTKEQHV